jgi:hypothetical protein
VLLERVRNLVPHDGGQLPVGQLERLDDARVDDDLAAGHAPGVHRLFVDDVHLPVPFQGVLAEYAGLGYQLLCHGLHAVVDGLVGVQGSGLLGLIEHLGVLLLCGGVHFLCGHEHQLLAVGSDAAAGGGAFAEELAEEALGGDRGGQGRRQK